MRQNQPVLHEPSDPIGVTGPTDAADAWKGVDAGWGRRAVEFATLSEPANCREYVAMQHRLGVSQSDQLLDVACGSGLAIELSALRGASCAGIDASERLVAIARDRNVDAEVVVGDMSQLPWDDATFTVVTSFRGIWGTTPSAIAQIYRVLVPGGRVGLTVWGHIKVSSGAWALSPFRLAAPEKVENQAAMVALGRPGVGEDFLTRCGFVDIERVEIPFVWEFTDPEMYARAIATTGPAYEAIQHVGEDTFSRTAMETARSQMRDGLPLRAEIQVLGFIGVKPTT
jgi:SAM-dependent methyltransferase